MATRILGVLALCGALLGCGGKSGGSGKPRVAVSIFPVWDIAKRVAGDRLDVVLVLPPGRSEHDYDPTPKEMARIAEAKLALAVGLELDGWVEKIVQGAAGGGVKIVHIGPKVDPLPVELEEVGAEHEGEEHHEHGDLDPHFWLDPVRTQKAVDVIVAAFSELDPAGADGYRARGEEVKQSLAALHAQIDGRAKGWSKKVIVTFHGSMGYYARRYGLTIAAVIEPFPGKEPTAKYMQEVLAAIKSSGAAALFSEPQLDKGPAQAIAKEAGVPLHELDPVGGTEGVESYEKLLTHNTDVLETALR